MRSEDETAVLRTRLALLWRAVCKVFEPLSPEMNANGGSHDHSNAESKAKHTESLLGTSIQPSYRGGWRNLSSIVTLIGSSMFGASFNFLDHNEPLFFGVAGAGGFLMLVGVWSTFKHEKVEHSERVREAVEMAEQREKQDREWKLQRVVDAYLRVTENIDPNSLSDGHKTNLLIIAGVTALQGNPDIIEVLRRIEMNGRQLPDLRVNNKKLLFDMLVEQGVTLYSDLDLLNFVLRHTADFFPGEELPTYK